MPRQGSRALIQPGWAPPFGWGRATRLDGPAPATTSGSRDYRSVCSGVSSSKARTLPAVRVNHTNAGTSDCRRESLPGSPTAVVSGMVTVATANITPMIRQLGCRSNRGAHGRGSLRGLPHPARPLSTYGEGDWGEIRTTTSGRPARRHRVGSCRSRSGRTCRRSRDPRRGCRRGRSGTRALRRSCRRTWTRCRWRRADAR